MSQQTGHELLHFLHVLSVFGLVLQTRAIVGQTNDEYLVAVLQTETAAVRIVEIESFRLLREFFPRLDEHLKQRERPDPNYGTHTRDIGTRENEKKRTDIVC